MTQVPSIAATVSISGLLRAITAGTMTGTWGNACFVVKQPGLEHSYVRLYADLSVLRANGATYLADLVARTGHDTLEKAVDALRQHPGPSLDSQHQALTLDPLAAALHAAPSDMFYFPVTQICVATMCSILVYLQTGHIQFAPLSSTMRGVEQDGADDADDVTIDNFVDVPQQQRGYSDQVIQPSSVVQPGTANECAPVTTLTSPKSIYRAARKFRLLALRNLAGEAIERQITPANCLIELFDSFSLKTPELFEKRLTYALMHWNEIGAQQRNDLLSLAYNSRPRAKALEAFNAILANTSITNRQA